MFTKTSFAAILLVAAGAPALAAPPERTIPYGDLNLSSPAGIATFRARIERVVGQACGRADPADLNGLNEVRRCRSDMLAAVGARRDALLAAAAPSATSGLAAGGTR